MRLPIVKLVLLAGLIAAPSFGADLELGLRTVVAYGSNTFSTPQGDEVDDFSLRVGPRIALLETRGDVRWVLRYVPTYEFYVESDGVDDWDHDVFGELDWAIDSRTELSVSNRFLDVGNLQSLEDEIFLPDGTVDTAFGLGFSRHKRNVFNASLQRRLSAVDTVTLRASSFYTDWDLEARTDTQTSQIGLSYLRTLSERHRLGGFVTVNRQEIELVDRDRATNLYNLSLQWNYQVSKTASLAVSAGPTWVDSDDDEPDLTFQDALLFPVRDRGGGQLGNVRASTCPTTDQGEPFLDPTCEVYPFVLPGSLTEFTDLSFTGSIPSQATSNLTYFASLALVKTWQRASFRLSYVRDTDTSSNVVAATGTVRDVITASWSWRPASRWSVRVIGNWQRSESATDSFRFVRVVEGATVLGVPDVARSVGLGLDERDDEIELITYLASVKVTYKLGKRAEAFASMRYVNTERRGARRRSLESDVYRMFVGVTYTFERIPLAI